tara:strand:- start:268 stop:498 length:231 start_codon:yes stop_codon:yes gene_type:complete
MSSSANSGLSAQIDLYLNDLAKVSVSVTGNDLLDMGIPEGTEMGRILSSIHKELLDGQVTNREEQVILARKIFLGG